MQEGSCFSLKEFQKGVPIIVLALGLSVLSGCGDKDSDADVDADAGADADLGTDANAGADAVVGSDADLGTDADVDPSPTSGDTVTKTIEGLGDVECINQDDTIACRGIPYAQPPVGDLRWKPPLPVESWEGIRGATEWPNRAPQPDQEQRDMGEISEDCLYLNLVMPTGAEELLPVMVFFHGGGLNTHTGNSEVYNNTALPLEGVVVVTVNSRLGAMGYLAHPALTAESDNNASGNYGTLDMIESLKWVQQNIHNFGGDKSNVTIFGESGGGTKVMSLLTSNLAKDLFHKAIVQSGSSSVRYQTSDLASSEAAGEELQEALGIEGEPSDPATLAAMREASMDEIIAVTFRAGLTVDGWVLEDTVPNIFENGKQNNVPLMCGAQTRDLGTPGESDLEAGVTTLANLMSKKQEDTYVYVFSHLPANWRTQETCAAFHGLELPYVFGRVPEGLDSPIVSMFAQPLCTGEPGHDEVDDKVAQYGVKLWSQFAKTGNPNYKGMSVTWSSYKEGAGMDHYLEIADPLKVGTDPASAYIPPPEEMPMPELAEHNDSANGFTIKYPETWIDGDLLEGEILRKMTSGNIPVPVLRSFVRPVTDDETTLREVFDAQLAAEDKTIGSDHTFDLSSGVEINGETYEKAVLTYSKPENQYEYDSVIIGKMINDDTEWIVFEVYTVPQFGEFAPPELPDNILETLTWN